MYDSPYLFTSNSRWHLARSWRQGDSKSSLRALHLPSPSVDQETNKEVTGNGRLVLRHVIRCHICETRRQLRFCYDGFRSRYVLWYIEIGQTRSVQVGCSGSSRGPLKEPSGETWGAEDARVAVLAESQVVFFIYHLLHCHKTVDGLLGNCWFCSKNIKFRHVEKDVLPRILMKTHTGFASLLSTVKKQ